MRPPSIVNFARAYSLSLFLSAIGVWLTRGQSAATSVAVGLAPQSLSILVAMGIAVGLLLLYLVGWRGSNVAKWVYLVLAGVGALVLLRAIPSLHVLGPLAMIPVAEVILRVAGGWLLFRPDARAWFARR